MGPQDMAKPPNPDRDKTARASKEVRKPFLDSASSPNHQEPFASVEDLDALIEASKSSTDAKGSWWLGLDALSRKGFRTSFDARAVLSLSGFGGFAIS